MYIRKQKSHPKFPFYFLPACMITTKMIPALLFQALAQGHAVYSPCAHRLKLSLSYTCSWCVILAAPLVNVTAAYKWAASSTHQLQVYESDNLRLCLVRQQHCTIRFAQIPVSFSSHNLIYSCSFAKYIKISQSELICDSSHFQEECHVLFKQFMLFLTPQLPVHYVCFRIYRCLQPMLVKSFLYPGFSCNFLRYNQLFLENF